MVRFANELTAKERRFVEEMVNGDQPGDPTAAARVAYPASRNPGQVGRQVLRRPRVQQEIAKMRLLRAVARSQAARPWEDTLPEAQEMHVVTVRAAAALVARKGANPAEPWTGPEVGLVKAGNDAAEILESYAVGKPVTRSEQGAPGEFRRLTMDEALDDLREHLAALQALGVLRLPPGAQLQLAAGGDGAPTVQPDDEDRADDEPEPEGADGEEPDADRPDEETVHGPEPGE